MVEIRPRQNLGRTMFFNGTCFYMLVLSAECAVTVSVPAVEVNAFCAFASQQDAAILRNGLRALGPRTFPRGRK